MVIKRLLKLAYVNYIYPRVLVYVRQTQTTVDDVALDKIDALIRAALS